MKVLIPSYTFTAATGEISVLDYSNIKLDQLLLITNVSKNKIIYSFAEPSLGGRIDNNVIVLSADTTAMEDTDSLQIFIEDYFLPTSESTLTAVNLELQKSNTLLDILTAQQTTINLDISAVNINTDSVESLIENTNLRLDTLTGIDYSTSFKQDRTNTLLEELTAKNTTVNLDVSAINLNTDEIEQLIKFTNTKLDGVTSIDYSTSFKQDRTNTLLEELTAKNTTINLDVSAINLNTDDIEGKLNTSNSLLNTLTSLNSGGFLDISNRINSHFNITNEIRVNTANMLGGVSNIDGNVNNIRGYTLQIGNDILNLRQSILSPIGGYTIGGYFNSYNLYLSSFNRLLSSIITNTSEDLKKVAANTLTNNFVTTNINKLYNIFGISTANIGQYIQIYDVTGSSPTGTPAGVFYVPANSNFNFDFTKGLPLNTKNVVIVNSLTPVEYNPGNSDLFITVIYS